MSVSKRLRYEILRRDDHACRYCGDRAPDVKLTVDHVVPVALGGDDKPANLVTACEACNSGKATTPTDAPLVENVADDALRWARAMELAAEMQFCERARRNGYADDFLGNWNGWTIWDDEKGRTVPLPNDWRNSILRFCDLGIELDVLLDLIEAAMTSNARHDNKFRYFCGAVWNVYRDRQEQAAALLAHEDAEAQS